MVVSVGCASYQGAAEILPELSATRLAPAPDPRGRGPLTRNRLRLAPVELGCDEPASPASHDFASSAAFSALSACASYSVSIATTIAIAFGTNDHIRQTRLVLFVCHRQPSYTPSVSLSIGIDILSARC